MSFLKKINLKEAVPGKTYVINYNMKKQVRFEDIDNHFTEIVTCVANNFIWEGYKYCRLFAKDGTVLELAFGVRDEEHLFDLEAE
jgi:hypothetical protein